MHTVRVKLVNNINLAFYKDTEPSSVQSDGQVERSRGITLVDLRSIRVIIIIIILIMIYYL